MGFDRKAYSNVLQVFDICLELPSDSEKYFSLVVDEFSELVHTRKLRCLRHLLVARPASQKHTEFLRSGRTGFCKDSVFVKNCQAFQKSILVW